MGEAWSEHPSWELVAEASEASGRDVEHLLLRADAEELRQTRNSQLSTYVLSMIVLDAVERIGIEPAEKLRWKGLEDEPPAEEGVE